MTLTKPGYKPRLIEKRLDALLSISGAVFISGPRWCGKTWLALSRSKSVFYVSSPKNNFSNRTLAEISPDSAVSGGIPHLIDEWQEVPALWDAVRFKVDESSEKGRFILTGSSTPPQKGILHSGTGRIVTMAMHPMSLFESGDSSGKISLIDLFSSPIQGTKTGSVELEQLIYFVVRGGWPGNLNAGMQLAHEMPRAYIQSLLDDPNILKHRNRMLSLLRSLARNESTLVSNTTLEKDIRQYNDEPVERNSIATYLSIFSRLFLLNDTPAFNPNLRSSRRTLKSPKHHLADSSLAAALLGTNVPRLKEDLETFGFLFEALCSRDLQIYAEAHNAALFHYRDDRNNEVDAIIELEDGRYGAFEIKLGANQIDTAARNLIKFKETMEKESSKGPSVLCVICGMTDIAYTRPDSVMVVPITALKD